MQNAHHGARRFTTAILREFFARRADPQAVSTLHVSDGQSERLICLVGDGIRLLALGERKGPDIPSYLLERGRVSVESLHAALETIRTSNCGLRQALLERDLLSCEDYDDAVYKLIRDEIFDLVFWEDAFCSMYPAPPPPEIFTQERAALIATVDFTRLSEEVGCWIDDWGRYKLVLYSDNALMALTGHGRRAARTETGEVQLLLEACAQSKHLRGVWRATGLGLAELCARLVEFQEKRWISVAALKVPEAPEQIRGTIASLEEALPRVIDKELVYEKLVSLSEKAKLHDKAIEYLSMVACGALERGDWQAACERLRRILLLDNRNLAAFQQLVKIYFEKGKYQEVCQSALAYAQALEGQEGPEALDTVAAMILKFPGSKLLVDEIQAGWFAMKGETERAVSAYQALADEYQDGGDPQRATGFLHKALACDPQNSVLRQRLGPPPGERAARSNGKKPPEPREEPRNGKPAARNVAIGFLAGAALVGFVLWVGIIWKPPALTEALGPSPKVGESPVLLPVPDSKHAGPRPLAHGSAQGAPEKAAARGEERAQAARPRSLLPPRILPSPSADVAARVCPHGGAHRLVTRRASDNLLVTCGDGCDLTLADLGTERVVLRLKGEKNSRWSIGLGAGTICQWQPGKPALICYRGKGEGVRTRWSLPAGVEAIAVSEKLLALREKEVTCVVEHGGAVVRCSDLPLWGEGLFAEDHLVLIPALEEQRQAPGAWVFDAATLELVWSSVTRDPRHTGEAGRR